jgi:DNA polymerase-3 subunit gamma/tau
VRFEDATTTVVQIEEATKEEIVPHESKAIPKINIAPKTVSAFSLSSIQKKKEHQRAIDAIEQKDELLPEDSFEEAKMQSLWAHYIEVIEAEGQKILASNLNSDVPKLLKDHIIWIELPNDTMKKEIERAQSGILNFLKKELNNYAIQLKITVSEQVAKQFAFTPEEKYEKLREKNPVIDLLRSSLDLDIT